MAVFTVRNCVVLDIEDAYDCNWRMHIGIELAIKLYMSICTCAETDAAYIAYFSLRMRETAVFPLPV